MISVTFSDLRNRAKRYFDAVEAGETLEVYRHGKPIALVSPMGRGSQQRWRRGAPLDLGGVSVSEAILLERQGSS